jgi:hypothetical protein
MWISVVSFNHNEKLAVDALLSDLASGAPSPWRRAGEQAIERDFGSDVWRLEHFPLLAQGNVVAAAELANLFQPKRKVPDFVVFYGCAGAVDVRHTRSAFLVEGVNYLSLGTVGPGRVSGELVTLKNKWLCHTDPKADVDPLGLADFPLCSGSGSLNIPALTGLPTARVAATDKVVRVAPQAAPVPSKRTPLQNMYKKGEWTYGEALGFVADAGGVVLVEMESYGISRIARALDIQERVVVMRVTTDALTDHGISDEEQRDLLMKGRKVLGHLLALLFAPSLESP